MPAKRRQATGQYAAVGGDDVAKKISQSRAKPTPSPWTQIKLVVLTIALSVGAVLCYVKAGEIQDDLNHEWNVFDTHCHNKEDPHDDCAQHLIHIRSDEQFIAAIEKAGWASAILSFGGFCSLMYFTREQLDSKIL
eukprot:TRINITY_DN339_c1_g1_i1.p2 TRINITY_DN339_c1_g1~~TRINITY_DN339_c1_g1_i1.p2  ORF type:complete len:136 (+),score=16.65 TRINITY_DN339_c1_g1_i1:709-1116(+)